MLCRSIRYTENITKIMIMKQSNKTVVYAINVAEPSTFIYKADCDVRMIVKHLYFHIIVSAKSIVVFMINVPPWRSQAGLLLILPVPRANGRELLFK